MVSFASFARDAFAFEVCHIRIRTAMTTETCIILFIKYPEKGKVKTRLSKDLGDDVTLDLYRAFAADILATVRKTGLPLRICYAPADAGDKVKAWLGDGWEYAPQPEGDLGARMEGAFRQAFDDGFERAVIIGSDIPDLPLRIINQAVKSLAFSDAVIGPSVDGGYYLIGFHQDTFLPVAFYGIPWSSPRVYPETMALLENAELRVHGLPKWPDVDTFEDVREFMKRNASGELSGSRTMQCLEAARASLPRRFAS
ncbi:MAG TPA: glycosyltransferase [Nitrospiraceae bacterium]|jgi:uncharacterized protein|nr:glycosyltransferase [Nitrospiraceae bacterium]